MPQYTWTMDSPTGTYKSHAMSRDLYEAAIAETVFVEHTRPESGYGKKKGESVTLVRVRNTTEPTAAELSETDRMPEDAFTLSTRTLTVREIGRAIPYTSLSEDLSAFDLLNPIQTQLRQQMSLYMDTLAGTAYKAALIKYVPTGVASSTITTNGTPGATASANVNVYHLEEIRDYLYGTLQAPMMEGCYVGIFSTLGLRGIKRDPSFEEWKKYTDPSAKYASEVGKIEQIRLSESNHVGVLPATGTGSVLGPGVVFGQDSVAVAEAMAPELRAAIPSDFGRSKAIAWYGILTFGLIWDTANAGEARVMHVTSL